MSFLTPEQRRFWQDNGWLVFESAVPAATRERLDGWVDEVALATAAGELRKHYFEQTDAGPKLCRTEAFIDDHAELAHLLQYGAVPALAAELLGEAAVVYKEKVNYKPPGGAGFKAHQDATAYAYVHKHVTCLIAVDAMTVENGCIEFAPLDRDQLLADDGDGCIADAVAAALRWQPLEVPAGAVVFFTSYVPHRSAANRSAASRRALYLTYNAASEGDHRADYYREREGVIAARSGAASARVSTIGHFQGRAVVAALKPPKFAGQHERFVDELVQWMAAAGSTHYDESVTQFEHAVQSANLAAARGGSKALIAAAFLHDVGHLLVNEHDGHGDFLDRDMQHERLGATWLARAFGPEVTEPIRLHVAAKRYLCSTDEAYWNGLSEASKRSLDVQGGRMSAAERAAFLNEPHALGAVAVRRIDDGAKIRGVPAGDAQPWREVLRGLVGGPRDQAAVAGRPAQ